MGELARAWPYCQAASVASFIIHIGGYALRTYFRKFGGVPFLGTACLFALLVFVFGERLNPFDRKSWNDFDTATNIGAP